eukprot:8440480-Pyramimonas_sp.AAC.1
MGSKIFDGLLFGLVSGSATMVASSTQDKSLGKTLLFTVLCHPTHASLIRCRDGVRPFSVICGVVEYVFVTRDHE